MAAAAAAPPSLPAQARSSEASLPCCSSQAAPSSGRGCTRCPSAASYAASTSPSHTHALMLASRDSAPAGGTSCPRLKRPPLSRVAQRPRPRPRVASRGWPSLAGFAATPPQASYPYSSAPLSSARRPQPAAQAASRPRSLSIGPFSGEIGRSSWAIGKVLATDGSQIKIVKDGSQIKQFGCKTEESFR